MQLPGYIALSKNILQQLSAGLPAELGYSSGERYLLGTDPHTILSIATVAQTTILHDGV